MMLVRRILLWLMSLGCLRSKARTLLRFVRIDTPGLVGCGENVVGLGKSTLSNVDDIDDFLEVSELVEVQVFKIPVYGPNLRK